MSVFSDGVVMSRVGVKFAAILVFSSSLLMAGCAQNRYESENLYSYDGTPVAMSAPAEPVDGYPIEDNVAVGYAEASRERRTFNWKADSRSEERYVYRGGRNPVTGRADVRQ